jgi:Ca-activated chloride channel family protein
VLADREHVAGAIAFVEQLAAAGGTNIHAALQASFEAAQAPDRPRYIVLLTDGQPTAGETSIDAIAELGRSQSESGTRLFAFGIGHDVNTLLLDRLARDSSGDALYIQPGADVFSAVTAFFEQIADPVLSAPALDMSGFGSSDPYPVRLQDLYAGLPAVVVGRYDTPGTSSVTLSGQRQGSTIAYSFDVALPRYDVGIGAVPRVWALRRIGSLLEEVKLGASATLENEVLALATRYGIGTAFTSFGLDEQGNTRMTYSPVPTDAVGSTAVGTSSLLDGYTKGATVTEAPAAADVRYFRDRVFPLQDGYYSDSSLIDRSDWVDLTFGSELYFAFAEAEAQFGAAEVLSLAKSVQFELLGRAFRVTGPEHPLAIAGNLPPEASSIPEPIFWPEPGTTVVTETTTTTNPDEAPDPDADSETANPKSADPNLIAGCTCRAARPRPLSIEAWWAMVGIVLVWFRRIDKTNACKRTWRHT